MTYITRLMKQKAVYWGNPVADGFGGYTFDDPMEISVRWIDVSEIFLDDKGKERVSNAKVQVSVDVVPGGYLMLGELSTVGSDEEDSPGSIEGADEIRGFQKVPDLKGTEFMRTAWLLRQM